VRFAIFLTPTVLRSGGLTDLDLSENDFSTQNKQVLELAMATRHG
jgi:hypothetical protein